MHHWYFGEHPGVMMSLVTFPVMTFSASKMLQDGLVFISVKRVNFLQINAASKFLQAENCIKSATLQGKSF